MIVPNGILLPMILVALLLGQTEARNLRIGSSETRSSHLRQGAPEGRQLTRLRDSISPMIENWIGDESTSVNESDFAATGAGGTIQSMNRDGEDATRFLSDSKVPSVAKRDSPTIRPSVAPSIDTTQSSSSVPSLAPLQVPKSEPSGSPSSSSNPRVVPSQSPSATPSDQPSDIPSQIPSPIPSSSPTDSLSIIPSDQPSDVPSEIPSPMPSISPTAAASSMPSDQPSDIPSQIPSAIPSSSPSFSPSSMPSDQPSDIPSEVPSVMPSRAPTVVPSSPPSDRPSDVPSATPSLDPTDAPSSVLSIATTNAPSITPSNSPSAKPSDAFSIHPTETKKVPTFSPSTDAPTRHFRMSTPTDSPTATSVKATVHSIGGTQVYWIERNPSPSEKDVDSNQLLDAGKDGFRDIFVSFSEDEPRNEVNTPQNGP